MTHRLAPNRRSAPMLATLVLLPLLVFAPGADASPKPWAPRPATYGIHATEDVAVEMSDGAVLRLDIYRPALADGSPAPGRFPTLLTQTPYGKGEGAALPYLVQRGYIDVVVDVRGTGSSGGTFEHTFSESQQRDGKELVEWAANQPWSTGAVGLHGASYVGINQLLTAARQPKGLKATFPVVANGDAYRTNFPGGYPTSLAAFALLYPALGATAATSATHDLQAAADALATRPAGIAGAVTGVAGLFTGDDTAFDGPYSHSMSPLSMMDRIKAPTFLVGGWSDALSQRDGPLMFRELQRRNVPVKLVMGPWTHTNPGTGLPADNVPSLDELHLRWFDHYVAGRADPGLRTWGPAFLHRAGDGYRRVDRWTVPGVSYRQAFLGAGTLGTAPPTEAAPDQLVWQPASGICSGSTYVGTFGLTPSTPCTSDNRINDLTSVTYDLPLAHDLKLTGPMSARLFVSTTGRDAHVVLRLEAVAPTGEVVELTTGWDTLSFRALDRDRSEIVGDLVVRPHHPYTRGSLQPVEAGEIYEWWVEIRPTSVHLPKGHTLRLAVQTADAARFLPTASDIPEMAGGSLAIHHDATHPSAIVLPVEAE